MPIVPQLAEILAQHRPPSGPLLGGIGAHQLATEACAHMRTVGLDATFHQLRHTFGSEAAGVLNGNIVAVRDLMGHASIETTMGYVGGIGFDLGALRTMYVAS